MAIAGALVMFFLIFWSVDGILAFLIGGLLLLVFSPILFLGLVFAVYALIRAVWHFICGLKEK